MNVIEFKHVSKSYGKRKVLDEVSFTVEKGEVYGLIGRNGAGKTTAIRILLGLATPSDGEVFINGKSGAELTEERKKIGAIIDSPSFSPYLSAFENMKAVALSLGITDNELLKKELRFVGLNPDDKLKTRAFSLGMKQRLAIAIALLGEPEILVLDEPVNGLDPTGIYEVREIITNLTRERGITVLISSHLLAELSKTATAYGVMNEGKIVKELRGDELKTLSRPFIKVVVSELKKGINVLIDNYKPYEFEILPFNTLAIYNLEKGVAGVASLFHENGVPVLSISEQDGDLESAFISMMGGVNHEEN